MYSAYGRIQRQFVSNYGEVRVETSTERSAAQAEIGDSREPTNDIKLALYEEFRALPTDCSPNKNSVLTSDIPTAPWSRHSE